MSKNPIPFFLLKMLFVSFVITTTLLLLLALLFYKLRWDGSQTAIGVYVIYFVSCFVPALLTGKKMRSRRLFWGIGTGAAYFLLLFAVSSLIRTGLFAETSRLLTVLLVCVGAGALGGIVS